MGKQSTDHGHARRRYYICKRLYAAVEFLKDTEINQYDFPVLNPVAIHDDNTIGA